MIGHATVTFPEGAAVTRQSFEEWCAVEKLVHVPSMAGGNVYCHGGEQGIVCTFGLGARGVSRAAPPDDADHVIFTAIWGGERKRDLARVAGAFWVRFGGAMFADEETRRLVCEGDRPACRA